MYFVFNLPFAWSRFLKHERAKGGYALVKVARLKSDNITLKAFCLFVFVLREKVNLEVLVDLKLGVSLGWHKHFWTEKIQIKDCWIFIIVN